MTTSCTTRPSYNVARRLPALAVGLTLLASGPLAAGAQGVIASGVQTDYGTRTNRNPGGAFGNVGYSIDDLCNASPVLGTAMRQLVAGIEREMTTAGAPIGLHTMSAIPGAPNRIDIERDISQARDQVCNASEPPTTVQPFVITYASCRMSMETAANAMVISMPRGQNEAYMLLADHATREVHHLNLSRQIDAATQVIGSGWSDDTEFTATGATGEHSGYPTKEYTFTSTGGMGQAGTGALGAADIESGAMTSASQLGNLVSVTINGNVWASDSAPGIGIVRSFYQNLTTQVQPDQNASFFGGLIKNQVGMLSKGMPIMTESTVRSKVMGRTMVSGKSKSVISNIRIVELAPDWCDERPLPEGYTITDVDEQLQQATGAAGAPGASDNPDMADAMQQMRQAMEQMTPEQQAMMEQFGLGSGVASSGSAGGSVATATRSSNASAALTTDNLVESVQKHLDALGYDPGRTDGGESVMTQVAISQFQAEKGMAVDGKVTPQLLGLLSAEVDKP